MCRGVCIFPAKGTTVSFLEVCVFVCIHRKSFPSLDQLSADMSLSQMSLEPGHTHTHSLDGKTGLASWHREGTYVCV